MAELPTGTVTFFFSDIEGSTRLVQDIGPDAFGQLLDEHASILRTAISRNGGAEIRTEGDSFFAVFPTPSGAVAAAVEAQGGLAEHPWPSGSAIRIRVGLHTGEGRRGGDDYVGIDVHRAARIAAVAHGGQVLLSDATRALVEHALPDAVVIRDLGRHRLKDLDRPEHLHDLVVDGLASDFPPVQSLAGAEPNLPVPRTSFVGRERERADVEKLLATSRLVTLTGPGGTGKTRLALRVSADQTERFDDGVAFVDLSAVTDPGAVPARVASTLGIREEPSRDRVEQLADHLGRRRILLVLDNLEQVVGAAPAIDRLLAGAPGLTILATSRVPLHLSGEQEYPIQPLRLPDPASASASAADVSSLATCESVMLFVQRASSVDPEFRVNAENAAPIAEIARRVDGLPLAIELAAGRLKVFGPQALLHRLEHRLPMLTGGPTDAPERHRTVRAAIEWSHDLLDAEGRRLFARLAAFRGGFSLDDAEVVCRSGLGVPVIDGLASLVDASLVRRERDREGEVRFGMLETIHEYAAERLAASLEEPEIRQRHADHVLDLALEAEPNLLGEDRNRLVRRLEGEHDNIRAALEWAAAGGDVETALRTAAALWRFWQDRGDLAEGRASLERLLALPGAETRGVARLRALGALGGLAYWQGDYEGMKHPYEEALDIAREIGDRGLVSQALLDGSFVPMLTARDLDRSRLLLEEALAEVPDDQPVLRAQILGSLGYLLSNAGDTAAAIPALEEALATHRELGLPTRTAEYLIGAAALRFTIGDVSAGVDRLLEAIPILAGLGGRMSLAMAVFARAVVASRTGDHVLVARLIGAASRIRDDGGGVPPSYATAAFGDLEGDARDALGAAIYDRAHADGWALIEEEAWAAATSTIPARPEAAAAGGDGDATAG